MEVTVVAAAADGTLARRVATELRSAGRTVRFDDANRVTLRGAQIFVDDEALPRALRRLAELQPGRLVFPTAVLCVAEADRAGGALAAGFRDGVAPADAPRAVDAVLGARPPVLLNHLRRDVEERFVPDLTKAIRRRALDKHQLLGACADLLRACKHLEKRIYLLGRLRTRQSLDDVHALQGRVELFLSAVADERRPRIGKLPRFPRIEARATVLGKHEPRYPRARDEVEATREWLREAGALAALGKDAESELVDAAARLAKKPMEALRAMLRIYEREVAERVARFDDIDAAAEPLAAIADECRERFGVGLLPPGIALPDHLCQLVRAGVEPPPDLYLAWCLDLRDLRFKRGAEIIDVVTRSAA
jgi:hypothetical protein